MKRVLSQLLCLIISTIWPAVTASVLIMLLSCPFTIAIQESMKESDTDVEYRYGMDTWSGTGLLKLLHVILVAALWPAAGMTADRMPVTLHHRLQQECRSCHGEQPAVRSAAEKCRTCHEETPVPSMESRLRVAGSPSQAPEPQTGIPPGMSLPMYYSPSRLGPDPNPMILVPAGVFVMGSDSRLEDEGPEQTVNLDSYYIDKYEVTNAQYKQFIDATGHHSPDHYRNRTYPAGKADHPVTYVSWYDARDYCDWAGKRLPTEEEWEKAARGTDGRIFPWGNEFELHSANTPVRWEKLKQDGDTTPVGAFEGGVSPYGVYDMSGNVWEWVMDWYGPHPGNAKPSENYGKINKVLKGGSWWDCSYYKCGISAPTFNRSFFNPRVKNSSFGFRCARDSRS